MAKVLRNEVATKAKTVLLLEAGASAASWADRVDIIEAAQLSTDDNSSLLENYGAVLLDAARPSFVALARHVHQQDPNIQVIAVTTPELLGATRQSLLYAPGLGEVWLASPTDVGAALTERAAGVTRQRRQYHRTRSRMELANTTVSPQRTERAMISDAYLAGLLRVLPHPVFSVDGIGRLLSANVAAETLFDRPNRQLVGSRLTEALGIVNQSDDVRLLESAAGEAPAMVKFHRPGANYLRVGELRAARMKEGGNAVWAVLLRDLTNEQETYRAVANAIPTLAWTARPDGFIDWYNRQWYDYTGTTPADMEGWGWQSVHHPEVLPLVLERWNASIGSGKRFEMTFPLRGANGKFRAFLTRVVPVHDENGNITRWVGTNTDVEAHRVSRRRVERLQALAEALAVTQTLEDAADAVVARGLQAAGADTTLIALREPESGAVRILQHAGFPKDLADKYQTIDPTHETPLGLAMTSGQPVFLEERHGADGFFTRYPAFVPVWERMGTHAVAALPLLAAGDVVGGMSFSFREPRSFADEERDFFLSIARQSAQAIERARLFTAERDARQHADEANRAKSQFLATMSHELRTPLNAISGHVSLVLEEIHGPVTEEQRGALTRVMLAQEHLLGLINDVLSFARLEGGRVEYHVEPIDVTEVISSVHPLVEPQMTAKGISLVVNTPAEPHAVMVCADRDKLAQILINLLSNATKFTDTGGTVTVGLQTSPGHNNRRHAVINVDDTGIGIPPDKLDSIFDPFVQVRPELTRTRDGTGLGLAISRDLARGMGGDLHVESEVGKGSSFTVRLPLA